MSVPVIGLQQVGMLTPSLPILPPSLHLWNKSSKQTVPVTLQTLLQRSFMIPVFIC